MPITSERKEELIAAGYVVEDMGAVWGPGWWEGQFRWDNERTGEFQDADTSDSIDDAWECADARERERAAEGAAQ